MKNINNAEKKRILIMDDEFYIRNSLTKLLNYLGYETFSTKNGTEAINIYSEFLKKARPFDIVILDLIVPTDIGGRETITELKKINPDIKAIVSCTLLNDHIISDYKKYGFNDVLIKPYGLDELKKVLL